MQQANNLLHVKLDDATSVVVGIHKFNSRAIYNVLFYSYMVSFLKLVTNSLTSKLGDVFDNPFWQFAQDIIHENYTTFTATNVSFVFGVKGIMDSIEDWNVKIPWKEE
ncbi:hypothetical protein VNO78_32299 [Psophocarpus tetragonolobus]|uniref:Uncharacterized protein n=1 Tax=Psophocarpus tetragonolobus TaxID=3891 RepID=A0AAN9NZH3_PSOTE